MLIGIVYINTFHLLNCAAPPAVTFDRVAFVPSGDNFNIQFYWNVSSFYKFMMLDTCVAKQTRWQLQSMY